MEIINSIVSFISGLAITADVLFLCCAGVEVLMIIFFLIKARFDYEGRLNRSLDMLNMWLYNNQTINTNNLIEFNLKIKSCPKLLRYHWQQFMLYREHDPSYYISAYNCIEKPLHTSSYVANEKNISLITRILAFFAFTFGCLAIGDIRIETLVSPFIILFLGMMFVMILRNVQSFTLSSLYQSFHIFQRYLDKASTSMPEYVDFEVLFTKKEIQKGIPVLNEYLEKRARQEQEELEKARINAVEHEKFNFGESGIEGTLMLDRAMKETEVYLNIRQRTLAEIQQLDSEIESNKRNYENVSKDYQRKLQASKETVERFRKQQEEITNRIDSNYIKKQLGTEIQKQEQLEKDQESATLRFNQEVKSLGEEILKRRKDLEERRLFVEKAMLSEYQSFSGKVFDKISDEIEDKTKEERDVLLAERDEISNELDNANLIIKSKEKDIAELRSILEKYGIDEGAHGGFYSTELKDEQEKVRLSKQNKKKKKLKDNQELISEEESIQQQYPQSNQFEQNQIDTPMNEQSEEGYYDEQGYYRYPNGAYYDPDGNYYDEFGGHYDKENNYYDAEGGFFDSQGNYTAPEHPTELTDVQKTEDGDVENMLAQIRQQNLEEKEKQATKELDTTDAEKMFKEQMQKAIQNEQKSDGTKDIESEEDISNPFETNNDLYDTDEQPETVEFVQEEPFKTQEQPKRKAGRPRKVEKVEEEVVTAPAPKHAGRPKKVVFEEPPVIKSKQETITEQPKRKAGRPRKVEKVEEEVVTPAPKRAGRPPKVKNEFNYKNNQEEPAKRKVGRPKKAEQIIFESKKRGPGRPPKSQSKSSFNSLNKTSNEDLAIIAKLLREEEIKLSKSKQDLNSRINSALEKLKKG
ncbi:MAG: hypothetical protein RR140_00245 [Clostridia bacterium]